MLTCELTLILFVTGSCNIRLCHPVTINTDLTLLMATFNVPLPVDTVATVRTLWGTHSCVFHPTGVAYTRSCLQGTHVPDLCSQTTLQGGLCCPPIHPS